MRKPAHSPLALSDRHSMCCSKEPGRYAGQLIGRSPYLQPVHVFAPDHAIGAMARVRVTEVMPHSVGAEIVPERLADARVAAVAL